VELVEAVGNPEGDANANADANADANANAGPGGGAAGQEDAVRGGHFEKARKEVDHRRPSIRILVVCRLLPGGPRLERSNDDVEAEYLCRFGGGRYLADPRPRRWAQGTNKTTQAPKAPGVSAPAKADLAAAKSTTGDGEKKYKAGDYVGACADFKAANEVKGLRKLRGTSVLRRRARALPGRGGMVRALSRARSRQDGGAGRRGSQARRRD